MGEALMKWRRAQAFHDAGWTQHEVINIPNALSMGRLLSGPVVAHLILQHHWPAAMITLAVAGISDWADGYAAKRWGQSSVLGSYLDPLADKVLVGCTVGALAAEVCLAPPLGLLSGAICWPEYSFTCDCLLPHAWHGGFMLPLQHLQIGGCMHHVEKGHVCFPLPGA